MVKVGILGAAGYTGGELIRLLINHPEAEIGVTRARKCVTLVGNEVTFEQMVQNTSQQKRYSGLCDRLKEA